MAEKLLNGIEHVTIAAKDPKALAGCTVRILGYQEFIYLKLLLGMIGERKQSQFS